MKIDIWSATIKESVHGLNECKYMEHIFELRMKDQIYVFTFIYSSFTGILRTHNMTSSQLAR